jgi:hypothetical protein
MMRRSEAPRLDSSIVDAARNPDGRTLEPAGTLILAQISNSAPIAGEYGRWLYECVEAWVLASPSYKHGIRANGRTFVNCLSVSELGNTVRPTFLSYGVQSVNLLGSFVPVKIPNGTPVVLSPHRTIGGNLVWLIVNTQAIDGTCTGLGGGADLPVHPGGGGG